MNDLNQPELTDAARREKNHLTPTEDDLSEIHSRLIF